MRQTKTSIPGDLRQEVLERDGYRCRYCGSTHEPLHMDHVYPESQGGETSISNLVTACGKCNNSKGAKVGIWPNPIKPDQKADYTQLYYGYILFVILIGISLLSAYAVYRNPGIISSISFVVTNLIVWLAFMIIKGHFQIRKDDDT